jgi:hypothetical protein
MFVPENIELVEAIEVTRGQRRIEAAPEPFEARRAFSFQIGVIGELIHRRAAQLLFGHAGER